jgi:hypothetical protein
VKVILWFFAIFWFGVFAAFLFGYTPTPWTIGTALLQSAFFFVTQALDAR